MKKLIAVLVFLGFVGGAVGQVARPSIRPRWDREVQWILNGQETLTYKTLASPTFSGTVTNSATNNFSGTVNVTGNSASTNLYVASDADSFKVRMYKYLYPLEIEIGNTRIFGVDSAGIGYFAGDLSVIGGDITGAAGNFVDIGEAADGSITFGRDDAGTVTLTSVDSDANAALTVSAGGTGALTLGDAGSTSAILSSDWAIDATGAATAFASIKFDTGDANISAVDTVKTGGGVVRWVKITSNGVAFYAPADTATVK